MPNKKTTGIERLATFVKERESIRLKKEAGEPKPWTADPILRSYRFTNVRRMDDKVSRWLFTHWYEPFANHPNMLAAVALARFVNKPESLGPIRHHLFPMRREGEPDWEGVKNTLRGIKSGGGTVFSGAYMVRGNSTKSPDKIGTVVDEYVRPLWDAHVKHPTSYVVGNSMSGTHAAIATRYGYGSFMAGQIVADLRWAVTGDWEDRLMWAPVGPGSARGLARMLYLPDEWHLVARDYVARPDEWLSDFKQYVLEKLPARLPATLRDRLEAMDYQNTLCEHDKYERVRLNQGRPKQLYSGT